MRFDTLNSLRGTTFAAALGVALALAPSAQAAFLAEGSDINLSGNVVILPTGQTATNATGLDFLNPVNSIGEGDLSSFTGIGIANITDIPEGSLAVGFSMNNFYTVFNGVDTLFFDLIEITAIDRDDVGGRPTVSASGVGVFRLNGYDNTQATFVITVQGDGTTTFSSSSEAIPGPIPAPEPVSLALFGIGLLGLGAAARRNR